MQDCVVKRTKKIKPMPTVIWIKKWPAKKEKAVDSNEATQPPAQDNKDKN